MAKRNNREDVYELQLYLRLIQLADGKTNLLNPDGVYGRETTDAVMSFQIANNIPATGRVDTRTWKKIYEEYLKAEEKVALPQGIRIYPLDIDEMKKGDNYDEIYALQLLLRKNDIRFNKPEILEITGVFDEKTENAVKDFQRMFGLTQTGRVDKLLWNKFANFHNERYINE